MTEVKGTRAATDPDCAHRTVMPIDLTTAPARACAACASLTAAVALLLVGSATAAVASDATLGKTLNTWSRTIGADARSISRNARQRHPRLMTASAVRFRKDALRARAIAASERPSSIRGRRAKGLVLRAFSNYAAAGTKWAASGRARVRGRRRVATTLARRAAAYARNGNRLLLAAGKLLP